MRAFRYRLAPALKRAQHVEQTLQIEVARLQEELDYAIGRLKSLDRIRRALHRRLRGLHEEDVDLGGVALLRRDLDRVDGLLARAALLRQEVEQRVAATRERLLEAARHRQQLENHRDDLAQRHRRGELAAETKHLDDLATVHFGAPRRWSRGPE